MAGAGDSVDLAKLNESGNRTGMLAAWVNSYPVIFVVYSLTRCLMFAGLLGFGPYGHSAGVTGDVRKYAAWAEFMAGTGGFPVGDPAWQYPPLAGLVFIAGDHITSSPVAGFMCIALAADFAIFLMLLLRRRGPRPNSAAWVWVAFAVLIGPVLLARFDVVTAVFAVAALILVSRPAWSGVAIGVGTTLKLWPILLVLAHPRKQLVRVTAWVLAVVVAIDAVLFLAFDNAGSFLAGQTHRGLQVESPAGAVFVAGRLFGMRGRVRYQYGSAEIIANGTGTAALVVTMLGLVLFAFMAYLRLRGRLEAVDPADVALVLALIAIVTSRVFSPQYMIWAAGIGAACFLSSATLMRPIVALCGAVAVLGQVTYQFAYQSLLDGGLVGSSLQLLRVALLLATTAWAIARVTRARA